MSPFDSNVKAFDLTLMHFVRQFKIDDSRLLGVNADNTRLISEIDLHLRAHIVHLDHRVYCTEPKVQTYAVSYPKTWWDAFKVAYPRLCKWLKPAEHTTVNVQWRTMVAFPDLPMNDLQYRTIQVWNSDPRVFTDE